MKHGVVADDQAPMLDKMIGWRGEKRRREVVDPYRGKSLAQRMTLAKNARTATKQELCSHDWRRATRSIQVCVTCGKHGPLKAPKVKA